MRDLVSNIGIVQILPPSVLTATATGTSLDLLGFGSVAFVIATGAIAASGNFAPKLQESDDNATFTDVAASDMQGSLPTALAATATAKVGYKGFKRYVRPVLTLVSGTSIAASVIAVQGDVAQRPVA